MTTTHISTNAIGAASKLSIVKLQSKLQEAQEELSTGRHADVGLTLGYQTGQTVSMRQEMTRLQSITTTNSIAKTRLEATDTALKGMADTAQAFLGQLVLARNGGASADGLAIQARNGLEAFTDSANASLGGVFLFGGINADAKPIATYMQNPPSAAQTAVASVFQGTFGMTQSDPGVANISQTDMKTFIEGQFADLFEGLGWVGTWSSASDQNVRSRISTSELIDTSTNANQEPFRKLAEAYTMVADLGTQKMNDGAFDAVIERAINLTSAALSGFATLRTNVGSAQGRIANADDRMGIQINVLTTHITTLEAVDPTEASTRVSTLLNQIETAYAVTARIQKLSILDFLPAT